MTTIQQRREWAREWCEFAVDGPRGRTCDDKVYQWIVEGRDRGPGYSSCGDLAHWLLYRLGCRAEMVNRDEHNGWAVGKNVSRLAWSPSANPWARPAVVTADALARHLHTGDILITWQRKDTSDAHVCIFDRVESGRVHTWDAGQGPMSVSAWSDGADHIELRRRVRTPETLHLRRFISLADVPWAAEPELPTGELFDALELADTDPAPPPEST